MEPFYFDSEGDNLFGVYHPANDVFSQQAVLICPPIYAEYFRTYRYLRKLADAWAQAGHHVLRFDYFGTGDSAGEWKNAGPDRWLRDIEIAVTELKDISGCDIIRLAGVRLGGSLAIMSACDSVSAVEVIVCDPIIDGNDYLSSLEDTHERLLDKANERTRRRLASLPGELAGFRREGWIDQQIPAIQLSRLDASGIKRLSYIASNGRYLDSDFIGRLAAAGVDVEERLCEDDCDWGTPSESAIQAFNVYEGLRLCL